MTLRELAKSGLFPDTTRIYFYRNSGNESYICDFDNKVTMGNLLTSFIEIVLDREIHFMDPTHHALIIYFKEVK